MWSHYRSTQYIPFLLEHGFERNVIDEIWSQNRSQTFQLDKEAVDDFEIGKSKKETDFTRLLNDVKFEGLVVQCASFSKLTNSQSSSLRKRIVEILGIIEKELEE